MTNKYLYLKVIQQYYSDYWEDASEYDEVTECIDWKHDVKEYRMLGYPTRTIRRRVPNPESNQHYQGE